MFLLFGFGFGFAGAERRLFLFRLVDLTIFHLETVPDIMRGRRSWVRPTARLDLRVDTILVLWKGCSGSG
jgi:hypothetical protein